MRALAIILLFTPLPLWSAHAQEHAHAMVIANDRQTAEAALRVMQAGGSAADAAVAALMVMSVVAPQAAGIGGGAMLLHFDGTTHDVTAWDGQGMAPAAALPGGTPRTGGRAVGVPGAVRMLEALHQTHGHLPWAALVMPAIRLAEQGAKVSAPLARAIAADQDALRQQPGALELFFTAEGVPLQAGAVLTNLGLAQSLRVIAIMGANGLLRGTLAADIAIAARGDERAGLLTTDDLAAYLPHMAAADCRAYRLNQVCTAPDTGSLLPPTDVADPQAEDDLAAALLAEANQTARVDFTAGLLANAPPGDVAPDSSIAIIDAYGNAVAMTAGLGQPFGSKLFVHGFPLNAALAGSAPGGTVTPALMLTQARQLMAVVGGGDVRTPSYAAQFLAQQLAWAPPRRPTLAAVAASPARTVLFAP